MMWSFAKKRYSRCIKLLIKAKKLYKKLYNIVPICILESINYLQDILIIYNVLHPHHGNITTKARRYSIWQV